MGVANDKSIGWAIAKSCREQGADLAFSYQGEIFEKRVRPLAESIGCGFVIDCDASKEDSIASCFDIIKTRWDSIDFIIHAIAFSNKDELRGRYVDTSFDNFCLTMNVSCYSLTCISRYAAPLMTRSNGESGNGSGSIVTLSYYGAEKAMPNYNVMGVAKAALECSVRYLAADLGQDSIRVNTISAGPVRTLAASGISDFRVMLDWAGKNAPLRRNISADEIAKTAVYLVSDLSSGVTGEVIHVDSGYHAIGMRYTYEDGAK